MTDWCDTGDAVLVPIDVEAVEGWDPAPPLSADWKPAWYSTDHLMSVLGPKSFPTPESTPGMDPEG